MNRENRNFKNLEIWKMSHNLALEMYHIVEKFPEYEGNNLTSQIRRAVTCLPLNIAEGCGAGSNRIFLNYLIFAFRSCRELEAALELSKDLGYLDGEQYLLITKKLDLFIRKLCCFMDVIDKRAGDRKKDQSNFYRHKKETLVKQRLMGREDMKYLS